MHVYRHRESDSFEQDLTPYVNLWDYVHDTGPFSHFLTRALERIFETRGESKSNFRHQMLDYVEGGDDLCKPASDFELTGTWN
jgi:hypothetical protein